MHRSTAARHQSGRKSEPCLRRRLTQQAIEAGTGELEPSGGLFVMSLAERFNLALTEGKRQGKRYIYIYGRYIRYIHIYIYIISIYIISMVEAT